MKPLEMKTQLLVLGCLVALATGIEIQKSLRQESDSSSSSDTTDAGAGPELFTGHRCTREQCFHCDYMCDKNDSICADKENCDNLHCCENNFKKCFRDDQCPNGAPPELYPSERCSKGYCWECDYMCQYNGSRCNNTKENCDRHFCCKSDLKKCFKDDQCPNGAPPELYPGHKCREGHCWDCEYKCESNGSLCESTEENCDRHFYCKSDYKKCFRDDQCPNGAPPELYPGHRCSKGYCWECDYMCQYNGSLCNNTKENCDRHFCCKSELKKCFKDYQCPNGASPELYPGHRCHQGKCWNCDYNCTRNGALCDKNDENCYGRFCCVGSSKNCTTDCHCPAGLPPKQTAGSKCHKGSCWNCDYKCSNEGFPCDDEDENCEGRFCCNETEKKCTDDNKCLGTAAENDYEEYEDDDDENDYEEYEDDDDENDYEEYEDDDDENDYEEYEDDDDEDDD